MIKYAIVKRRNPATAAVKYYAARTDSKLVPTSQLVSRMVESCTVTQADASAVISAYVSAILRHLKNGRSCKIDGLGIFSVNLSSKGSESRETFTPDLIRGVKINFRPDKAFSYRFNRANPNVAFRLYVAPAAPVGGGDEEEP